LNYLQILPKHTIN